MEDNGKLNNNYSSWEHLATQHYENFPIYLHLFPADIKHHVSAIYSFARIADDIADEDNLDVDERLKQLLELEQHLYDCYEGKPTLPLFVALQETINARQLPIEPFLSLLITFKMDILWQPFMTMNDLLTYCEHSTHPIGKLMMLLFGINDHQLIQYSNHICNGLQMTNFLQDITIDLEKNRIYIPDSEREKFNITIEDIRNKKDSEAFRKLIKHMVDLTQQQFDIGKPLLSMIPNKRLQLFVRLVWLGSVDVLQKIRKNNYDVLSKRIVLSKFNKFSLLYKSFFIRKA